MRVYRMEAYTAHAGERKNQRSQILEVLLAARGGEVPSPDLARISLQYNARILELREMGLRIISRTERRDGKTYGYFHLEMGAPAATPAKQEVPAGMNCSTPSLFGELRRESDYPD